LKPIGFSYARAFNLRGCAVLS